MRFKEWLKIDERAQQAQPKTNFTLRPPSVYTWGSYSRHNDDKLSNKALGAAAGAVGVGVDNVITRHIGLVTNPTASLSSIPSLEASEAVRYYFLPLQIPRFKHNNSIQSENIKLEPGSYITPKSVFKQIINDRQISERIRHKEEMREDANNKYLLLEEREGNWNYDPRESKQFTRALIYKCVVDDMNNSKDRAKYDINSFETVHEEEKDGLLTTYFSFSTSKNKGGFHT